MTNYYMDKVLHVRVKGSAMAADALDDAQEISSLEGVEKVVLLPDSFTKDKYKNLSYKITIPSSSVIATEKNILYPQFRSRGINCGMSIIALPLNEDEVTDELYRGLVQSLTHSFPYYVGYRLRMPLFADIYDLSFAEFNKMIEGDTARMFEKFGLEFPDSVYKDFGDSLMKQNIDDITHFLNRRWLERRTVRMRYRFGRYFGGNHYFEIQKVSDDVPSLNLHKGQLVAMVHTGCQGIESVVRPDLAEKYFFQKKYIPTYLGDEMYSAYFSAQSLLLYYGTTYRLATAAYVRDFFLQKGMKGVSVVLDKGHNYVRKETINGEEVLFYRHNAERLTEGELAIVSGLNNQNSYIVQGLPNVPELFNTIDHGLGSLIKRGLNKVDGKVVQIRAKNGLQTSIKTFTEAKAVHVAADEYHSFMESKGFSKKICTLEPLFNLKYS